MYVIVYIYSYIVMPYDVWNSNPKGMYIKKGDNKELLEAEAIVRNEQDIPPREEDIEEIREYLEDEEVPFIEDDKNLFLNL